MQVNSIGALNTIKSTSFGKKENNKCSSDCTPKDKLFITLPRAAYNHLVGMAMLAAVLGGSLPSCEPDGKYVEPETTEAGQNNGTTKAGTATTTYVVTPEDVAVHNPTEVQKMLKNMFSETLGLKITTPINTSLQQHKMKSATLQSGDISQIAFADVAADSQSYFTFNADESTDSTAVFNGSETTNYDGNVTQLRYTVSKTGGGLIIKKENYDNGKFHVYGTYELTPNADNTAIEEKIVKADGSKETVYTYERESETSLICVDNEGFRGQWKDVSIIAKE